MPTASVANAEKLEIVNNTGRDIKAYYLVQASYKDWGPERLGSGSFDNGQTRIFQYDPQFRYFKFKIVFANGGNITWSNDKKIDFSGLWRLTIYQKGSGYSIKSIKRN